jgi:hypothetical protein
MIYDRPSNSRREPQTRHDNERLLALNAPVYIIDVRELYRIRSHLDQGPDKRRVWDIAQNLSIIESRTNAEWNAGNDAV